MVSVSWRWKVVRSPPGPPPLHASQKCLQTSSPLPTVGQITPSKNHRIKGQVCTILHACKSYSFTTKAGDSHFSPKTTRVPHTPK